MGISSEQFRIRIGNFNNMKIKEKKYFDLHINKIKMNIKCFKKIAPIILLFGLAIIHTQNCQSLAPPDSFMSKTTSNVKSNIKEASQENATN